jgi:hypothetical protein
MRKGRNFLSVAGVLNREVFVVTVTDSCTFITQGKATQFSIARIDAFILYMRLHLRHLLYESLLLGTDSIIK